MIGDIGLAPAAVESAHPTFTVRRFCPCESPARTLIVFDDELIGDAAISAARGRTIDGTLTDTELVLIGFGQSKFAALHQLRGQYFTFVEADLSVVGMVTTGAAAQLAAFVRDDVLGDCQREIGLIGYSLSALFAIDLLCQLGDRCNYLAMLSPSLWLDTQAETRLAGTLARRPETGLFLCAGGKEDQPIPADTLTMCERVAAQGTRLEAQFGSRAAHSVYPEADHTGIILAGMDRAITEFGKLPPQR